MDDSEQYRHECECRYWVKATGGKKREVDALMVRITKNRGKSAADYLLAGMRAERDKDKK